MISVSSIALRESQATYGAMSEKRSNANSASLSSAIVAHEAAEQPGFNASIVVVSGPVATKSEDSQMHYVEAA